MSNTLCNINDLNDPDSRGFTLSAKRKERRVFIVKKDAQVFAYENKCPHAGINLEWQDNQFLDTEEQRIQCSVHGALFEIQSGQCVSGPCNGESLTSLKTEIDSAGNIILLD